MRLGLIFVGMLMLFGIYLASNYFSPNTIEQLRLEQSLCSPASGISAQNASVAPQQCQGISAANLLLNIIPIASLIAVLLVITGIFMPEPRREIRLKFADQDDDAMLILKRRFARGEITKEEYREAKKELSEKGNHQSNSSSGAN